MARGIKVIRKRIDPADELRNISRHQYGALIFVYAKEPTVEELNEYKQGTLLSLGRQGWVTTQSDGHVRLTKKGVLEVESYENAKAPRRKDPEPGRTYKPLSSGVIQYLKIPQRFAEAG